MSIFEPARYSFSLFSLPTFVTAILAIFLGGVVFFKEKASRASLAFLGMTLSISIWLTCRSLLYVSLDENTALFWAKASYIGVPFIPVAAYQFAISVLDQFKQNKESLSLSWFLSAGFCAVILSSDALIVGLHKYSWGYYPKYGWLSLVFIVCFLCLTFASIRLFFISYKKADDQTEARRSRFFLIGFSIAALACIDYLPAVGVAIYPVGHLPLLIFFCMTAWGIQNYKLLDISPAFAAGKIIETMDDALLVFDQQGIVRLANRKAEELFGYSQEELVGKDIAGIDSRLFLGKLEKIITGKSVHNLEISCQTSRNGLRLLSLSSEAIRHAKNKTAGIVCVWQDVTDRKNAEESLRRAHNELELRVKERTDELTQSNLRLRKEVEDRLRAEEALLRRNTELDSMAGELKDANVRLEILSQLDPLTELLNRRGLQQILSVEIRRARENNSHLLALLVDLEQFHEINETFGYAAGDIVLKEVSRKLKNALRERDHIARLGGDEFLILLPSTRPVDGIWLAERLRLAVSESPIAVSAEQVITIKAQVGLVLIPRSISSVDELLSETHIVLRQRKKESSNIVYTQNHKHTTASDQTISRILAALNKGEGFWAVAQPIVKLNEKQVIGYEFLSRMSFPGFEMPNDFFRICQEGNILTLVDHQCLKTCAQSSATIPYQMRKHFNLFPSTLINIPVQHLLEELPVSRGAGTCCIEISEQQIIGDPSYLIEAVKILKQAGVLIAVDDVGFGYSCLESLIMLEPDVIKLDKRCVQGIARDSSHAHSLIRLLKMANILGAEVMGEGIELAEDLEALKDLGVLYGQGYLLGRPMEIASLGGIINQSEWP
jgi:diguanylate cyclase (GGDEF)-like protein/PAS domain S-box-containing protein